MSAVLRFLRFLRESWAWWLVPLAVAILLTLALAWAGRGTTVAPFDYGTSAPGE